MIQIRHVNIFVFYAMSSVAEMAIRAVCASVCRAAYQHRLQCALADQSAVSAPLAVCQMLKSDPIFFPSRTDAAARMDARKHMDHTPNAAAVYGPDPRYCESS